MVILAVSVFAAQAVPSIARFTDAATVQGSISAGSWVYYLHNNPTPPAANTTFQANLAATGAAPSATQLYNYDTNCDTRTGRRLTRSATWAPSPGTTTTCYYANWRLPAAASPLTLGATVTVDAWVAVDSTASNRTGAIAAYLRDFDPAAGTYREIASGSISDTYTRGRTFYERQIAIAVPLASRTLAAGHLLEVKLEAASGLSYNMLLAYDTTAYDSFVDIR